MYRSVCIRSNSPPCPGPYQLEQYTNVGHFCADIAGRFPNLRRLKMDLGTYQWLSDPETLLCFSRLTSLEELEIEQVYGPEEEDWDAVQVSHLQRNSPEQRPRRNKAEMTCPSPPYQRSRELVLGFPKLRHLDVKGPFPFPIPVPSMPTLHHGMYVEEDGILDQFGGSYDALWEHQESHLREWAGSVGIALIGGMIELASEAPNLRRIFWQPWDPEFESFQWIEMRVVRGDTVTVEGGLMEPVYEMPGRKRVGDKVIVPFRT